MAGIAKVFTTGHRPVGDAFGPPRDDAPLADPLAGWAR